MSKATPGAPYTIAKGDNLTKIANQAYGDASKWQLIWKANQNTLRSGDPNTVFPGEVIQIPINPVEATIEKELGQASDEYLPDKGKEELTIFVESTELIVDSARVARMMDTISDGWTARIAWDPDDKDLSKILKPYRYNPADVYVGPWLTVRGCVYTLRPTLSPDDGYVLELEGFSATADLMDSTIRPPYEQKKVTLEQRARDLVEPLGISVIFDADDDEQFDKITMQKEDKIFDHLVSLAQQRKVLVSSTAKGDLIFYRANTTGKSVGTITDDAPPHQTSSATFDGRKRFNAYRAVGPTPKRRAGNALEAIAKDEGVPKSRLLTFSAPDATKGNIQSIADWKRSKQLAEGLEIPFPVNSWYAPDGELWRENTIVTVKSKTIFVPDGFDFLIKAVEFVFEPAGNTAILTLVPPSVYTGEPIEEPWA